LEVMSQQHASLQSDQVRLHRVGESARCTIGRESVYAPPLRLPATTSEPGGTFSSAKGGKFSTAGNTSRIASVNTRVHPRSRGDHRNMLKGASRAGGPPPLARGPLRDRDHRDVQLRSTPARAGTTPASQILQHALEVHPRARGDHTCPPSANAAAIGPPPLARGPPATCAYVMLRLRSTPARAGTTTPMAPSPSRTAVHPRSRGDHMCSAETAPAAIGPPPLARGPPLQRAPAMLPDGSTPARAGTTSGTEIGRAHV